MINEEEIFIMGIIIQPEEYLQDIRQELEVILKQS